MVPSNPCETAQLTIRSCSPPGEIRLNIYVGPDKRHFAVPLKLLRSYTFYFHNLLTGYDAKSPKDPVYLADDKPAVFDLLVKWMILGDKVLDEYETSVFVETNRVKALEDDCHFLCELRCLSERLEVFKICPKIMNRIENIVRRSEGGGVLPFRPGTVRMVLKTLHPDSDLHEYVLHKVVADLLHEKGHEFEYYESVLLGPDAVPGLVRILLRRMKGKRNE